MAQRIKGQEVQVNLIVNGAVQDTLTDIKSLELAAKLEIITEGYLGEGTDRRDDQYHGVSGSLELHFSDGDVFDLIDTIIERARRREAGTRINIKCTLAFPGGDLRRVLIPDVYFGEIPISFGSRTDYGSIKLDFEAADLKFL